MTEIAQWRLSELAQSLKDRQVTSTAATQSVLKQIDARNPTVNAYTEVLHDAALYEAARADEAMQAGHYRGTLHGVPVAFKDMVFTQGVRTTMASPIYKDFVPEEDAHIVSLLKQAGAVTLGKLNMHQFAFGATGDVSLAGPARNPHDLDYVCGGSSSGSAAALAANMAFATIGTDTGGSIRIPASCCGIVGMKATFGSVSKRGVYPLSWTLDHTGPMTRTVRDNALFLNALVGYDSRDPYSVERKQEDFTRLIGQPLDGITIGIPQNYYFDIMDAGVLEVFQRQVRSLESLGAVVKSIEVDYLDEALAAHQMIIAVEAFASLESHVRQCPDLLDKEVLTRTVAGAAVDAISYVRSLQMRDKVIDAHRRAFEGVDAMMMPTLCILPPKIGQRSVMVNGQPQHARSIVRMVAPTNLTGFPAISVPGGFVGSLPVGIQFIGMPWSEAKLYQIAHQIESPGA